MRNRKKTSLIACSLLVCLAISTFAGCQKKPAQAVDSNQNTQASITNVSTPPALENVEASGSLKSWELTPSVWSSSNGATVTFTAVPTTYSADMAVYFGVYLNGNKVEDVHCSWDGKVYSASVDLEAANGYEYECTIYQGQGEGEQIALSDAYDSLVYLQNSLGEYCSLYISDFKVEDGKFVVTAGFAHVQMAQLTPDGNAASFQDAKLIFQLNGETIETQIVDLPVGEGAASREASLSSISFNMPQMDDDYQLDLNLEVNLSGGKQLTANGGSWFYNNGELKMSAG